MKTIINIFISFLYVFTLSLHPTISTAQIKVGIGVRVHVVPPLLPVYEQPLCPGDGYLWVPGYWAWNGNEYYWVPGEWMEPPEFGYLWTPCYWGFSNGFYVFHRGYWGRNVGYYGGVNYGYGYYGSGFYGGRWRGSRFEYNAAVMHVNRNNVHNVYNDPTVNRFKSTNRAGFNGPGGVRSKPTSQERLTMQEKHIQPSSLQNNHQLQASKNRSQFISVNNGHPGMTVMNPTGSSRKQSVVQNQPSNHQVVNRNTKYGNPQGNAVGNRPVRNEMNRQQNHSSNPVQQSHPLHSTIPHEQSAHSQNQPTHQMAPQQHQQREQMAPRQMAPTQHQEPRGNNREHER